MGSAPKLRVACLCALLVALGAGPTGLARATLVEPRDIVQLIDLSQDILVGRVLEVSDGFDERGVPYTEVTILPDEVIRGPQTDTFVFRQFGLLKPHPAADGRVNLGVSPAGWPRFEPDEHVLVFLHRPGVRTGLRTTVGLTQGKFSIHGETITNALENRGLLRGVEADSDVLATAEVRRLLTGRLTVRTLVDFVRRAVRERWVEEGRLRHAQR